LTKLNKYGWVAWSVFAGFLLGWYSLAFISVPGDTQFLRTTTSFYFEEMSRKEFGHVASYFDCRLEEADSSERAQGIAKFGLCQSETESTDYYLLVALTPTASVLFWDMEESARLLPDFKY